MSNQRLADKRETINTKITRLFDGNDFRASWLTPEGSLVADNAVFGIVLLTNTVEVLLDYEVAAAGGSELLFYEAPTIGTTGTSVTVYNANRSTPGRGSQFLAWHTPANVTGTIISQQLIQAGETVKEHWILTTGTFYAIIGVNRSGSSEMASVKARWYETNGET